MFRYFIVTMLILLSFGLQSKELHKVPVDENSLLLLSVKLNSFDVSQSVDAYQNDKHLLIAIEPLFDALEVKYQLYKNKVDIWKNNEKHELILNGDVSGSSLSNNENNVWADDGYYIYLSLELLKNLFEAEFIIRTKKLLLEIKTNTFQFPITVLAEVAKKRNLSQLNKRKEKRKVTALPITIKDQYRLATLPHGQVSTRLAFDNDKQKNSVNVQLVSDLLYHSANLNLSKFNGGDVTGGLTLSRYKTSPSDYILGVFDYYKIGDISSVNNSTLTKSSGGVGINFTRAPKSYRRENTKIDIEQVAPPGWEAELYHNSQFIETVTVPETGLLVFEDQDVVYGNNTFKVKIYGPYGEEKEFTQNFNLKSNPLSGGSFAYSLYGLDTNRSLLNNSGQSDDLTIDSVGGIFDYGISDLWQVGVGFRQYKKTLTSDNDTNEDMQTFTLKNNFNLPGMLLENEFAFDQYNNYQQKTSLFGQAFGNGTYNLEFSSGNGGFETNDTRNVGKFKQLSSSYTNRLAGLTYRFSTNYLDNETSNVASVSNTLSYNLKYLNVSNKLTYNEYDGKVDGLEDNESLNNLTGSLSFGTSINRDFRLSANILYTPKSDDDIISKSSSLSARWSLKDPWDLNHYLNLNYKPVLDSGKKWRLSHSMAWEAASHRLSLQSRYDQADNWSLSLNFNFFFGYDYHNNRAHFSNYVNSHSASLNIHSYLDRQYNGRPDVLDYDLEGVKYSGNPAWENLESGKNGRIILHGAQVDSPLKFQAHWKSGSKTINNDYVIYTHPGARVDVNMPFYLSSEIAGFVYRGANEIAVSGVIIDLIDEEGNVINSSKTDYDGYYEFLDMEPNGYQVIVNNKSLRTKGLSSDVIGYKLLTPSTGGFAELPNIILERLSEDNKYAAEKVIPFVISEDIQELLIHDEDETKVKNLFTLPTDEKITAEHDLSKALAITENQKAKVLKGFPLVDNYAVFKVDSVVEEKQANISANKVSETSLLNGFTIQLGAFTNLERANQFVMQYADLSPTISETVLSKAKTIFKVISGEFKTKIEAQAYAENNKLDSQSFLIRKIAIEVENFTFSDVKNNTSVLKVTPLKRWVIQFHAGQVELNTELLNSFSSVKPLYTAVKQVKNSNQMLYCLLSDSYNTKQGALNALQRFGLSGWVTDFSNYQNVLLLEEK